MLVSGLRRVSSRDRGGVMIISGSGRWSEAGMTQDNRCRAGVGETGLLLGVSGPELSVFNGGTKIAGPLGRRLYVASGMAPNTWLRLDGLETNQLRHGNRRRRLQHAGGWRGRAVCLEESQRPRKRPAM